MVIGSRYLNGNSIPLYRRIGQEVLDRFTNINSVLMCLIQQSGFRAFGINTVPFFNFRCKDFSIESEMLSEVVGAGLKVKEVDVRSKV